MTTDGRIVYKYEAFVHIKDLCQNDKLRYHLSRRFDVLPSCFKGIYNLHKRGHRILEESFAFSIYLHYVELGVSKESAQEHDLEDYDEKEKELAIEHSEEHSYVQIEKKES